MTSNRWTHVMCLAVALSVPAVTTAFAQQTPPPTPPTAPVPPVKPEPMVIRIPDLEPLLALQNVDVWKPLQNINLPDLDMMSFQFAKNFFGVRFLKIEALNILCHAFYKGLVVHNPE